MIDFILNILGWSKWTTIDDIPDGLLKVRMKNNRINKVIYGKDFKAHKNYNKYHDFHYNIAVIDKDDIQWTSRGYYITHYKLQ